jgi:hypothetical protein
VKSVLMVSMYSIYTIYNNFSDIEPCIASWTATIHFYMILHITIDKLIKNTTGFNISDPTVAWHGSLMYNPALHHHLLGTGTFKKCQIGQLNLQPMPTTGIGSSGKTIVAIKHPFALCSVTNAIQCLPA